MKLSDLNIGDNNFIVLGFAKSKNGCKLYGYDKVGKLFKTIASTNVAFLEKIGMTDYDKVPRYDGYSGQLLNRQSLVFSIKHNTKTVTYICEGEDEVRVISMEEALILENVLRLKEVPFLKLDKKYVGKIALVNDIILEGISKKDNYDVILNEENQIELRKVNTTNDVLRIPRGIEIIKRNAIVNLSTLHQIKLPNTLIRIEEGAIAECENLRVVQRLKFNSCKLCENNYIWENPRVDYTKQMTVEQTEKLPMQEKRKFGDAVIRIYFDGNKEIHTLYPAGCVLFDKHIEIMYKYIKQAKLLDKQKSLILRSQFNGITFDVTKEMKLEDYKRVFSDNLYAALGIKV